MSNKDQKTPVVSFRCPLDVQQTITNHFGSRRTAMVLLAKWAKEVAALEAGSPGVLNKTK